uniref:Uncharacterized protein n=1 Tax=Leersia perrieri TaxID=77586 RepID=A0A0D9VXX7_9ORYZ
MAAIHHQHHQIKAPTPTWFLLKATPPPRVAAAYSPLLLSPYSVWLKTQDTKKSPLPASPRISCMGKVKGRTRRCSAAHHGGKRLLERLAMGLFGRRRRTSSTSTSSSRACSKVRDVPSCSSASGGRNSCVRSGVGAAPARAVCTFDPPLPVVKRTAANANDNAPTLWERRRGGGNALTTLRLR